MRKQLSKLLQIAIMLFVLQAMLPQLMAQPIPTSNGPIGSIINISDSGVVKYWNNSAWITVAPGLPGQKLQFTSGNPAWVDNPQGIITNDVTDLTGTTATSGGNILSDGGAPITARGVCWSLTPNPTITNSFTTDDIGKGSFVSSLTGLTSGVTYYVRTYATNSVGTVYGAEISFLSTPTVTDFDGNVYPTVTIGTQTWLGKNLNVTHYRNGDPIPNVTNDSLWSKLITGAYCNYNNNSNYASTYGRIYNYYAVVDSRKLCPVGWHSPTDAQWGILETYLGTAPAAGGKLKETGLAHWNSPNSDATNVTGFTALPGGARGWDGTFGAIGNYGYWWTSTQSVNYDTGWLRYMSYLTSWEGRDSYSMLSGCSVRCLKDQ